MRHFLLFLLVVALVAAIALRVRYGGGDPYEDLRTTPLVDDSALEVAVRYPEPIGNVAISPDGRLFFTVHPESRPQGNRLLEHVNGAAVPFPDAAAQSRLFDTVLGLAVDARDRLWTIDNGNHGFGDVRLLAFDLASGDVVHEHRFSPDIAPAGSFLQDLRVTADGRYVLVADASVWRKSPAIVVYDAETGSARRALESHPSVTGENYVIRNHVRDMVFAGGLVNLKTGVDGLTLGPAGEWLFFGAMNRAHLYRVPVPALLDTALPARALAAEVEEYARKPLNDGLASDAAGNVFVTDVEHGAVFVVGADRRLQTLVQSGRIRWADSLAFGADGSLYIADSAIPEQVLKSRDYILSRGPYFIYRLPAAQIRDALAPRPATR